MPTMQRRLTRQRDAQATAAHRASVVGARRPRSLQLGSHAIGVGFARGGEACARAALLEMQRDHGNQHVLRGR